MTSIGLDAKDVVFKQYETTFSKLLKTKHEEVSSSTSTALKDSVILVDVLRKGVTIDDYIRAKTELATKNEYDDPFCIMNIDHLISRYKLWRERLPNIRPFYAVKSNNDPQLLSLLANIGTGFDCASKREIEQVLELGVSPDDIIFAHPCKQLSHIRYARDNKVSMMTFDNEAELHKIAAVYKDARLLVRIKCDDLSASFPLGNKFGVSITEAYRLVDIAKRLNLNLIGVCFHIGSGMKTPVAYGNGIEMCHKVFEYAASVGYHMTVLDIGGGFSGFKKNLPLFKEATDIINDSIMKLFSHKNDLTIIAEPGQYFCHSCVSLVVQVTSKRDTTDELYYYVNDGMFGTLLGWSYCLKDMPLPRCIKKEGSTTEVEMRPCSIWGPTADVVDKICDTVLPVLDVGEWLVIDEIGAYSVCMHSEFNGYLKPSMNCFMWTENC